MSLYEQAVGSMPIRSG